MRFATVVPMVFAALSATAAAETCQAILNAEYPVFAGTEACARCENRCTTEDGWCWRKYLDLLDYNRRNCIYYGSDAAYCLNLAVTNSC